MALEQALLLLPQECLLLSLANSSLQDLCSLACTCTQLRDSIKDPQLWKQLAEAKWGAQAIALRQGRETDWVAFVKKRICVRTIRYPTPSAVLTAPSDEVKALIAHPLGLPDVRYKAISGMSRAFLAEDWEDVIEFHGCGKFVSDSWRIFCCGDISSKGVDDVNLKRYLRWANTGQTEDPKKAAMKKAVQRLPAAGTLRSGAKRKEAPTPTRRSAARSRPAKH